MIPERLVLSNFLSYGEPPQSLDFTRFHVACLTGANGHGKSALLDAITYALWGQARKGSHDRKPDDGLLRLGARQMRVEFTFRLDDGCYRVIRAFRKRPRSSVSEVELQVQDPATGVYRPLSEAGSAASTQARIDRLLAMDYETFTNSAFLVQGHADAFTRKGARQRKELLAQVLGLGRYDELQERARQRMQASQGEIERAQQRLAELDAELDRRAEVDAELLRVETSIEQTDDATARAEKTLQVARERHLRAVALRQENVRCQTDVERLEASARRLGEQRAELVQRRDQDAAILSAAARIDAEITEYEALQVESTDLSQRLQQVRRLESEIGQLRQQVQAARHEVEQQLASWDTRRESLDEGLLKIDAILQRGAQIEADWAAVEADRRAFEVARERSRRAESLQRKHEGQLHAIALEERRLEERAHGLHARVQEVDAGLCEDALLQEQLAAAQVSLAAKRTSADQLQGLREQGTQIKVQVAQVQERLAALDDEERKLAERAAAFGRGDLAQCPLCGTGLDDRHRARLDAELATHTRELTSRRTQQQQQLADLERQLADRRAQYCVLESASDDLAQLESEVAHLRARRQQIAEHEVLRERLQTELRDAQRLLGEGLFAAPARSEATRLITELAALEFSAQELTQLEERLRTAGEIEARHQRLLRARTERSEMLARREQAETRATEARRVLAADGVAALERSELAGQEAALAALAYDEERHQQVRERLVEMADAPAARERLASARERQRADAAAMEQVTTEQQQVAAQREELTRRRQALVTELAELADAEQTCVAQQVALEDLRLQRDELLGFRGALQARREHLERLAAEARTLRAHRGEQERDQWLYAQLVEAFGKDGIQALVIESAIPEIEAEANAILRGLTDNRIQISIDSLRDLKGGGSRETLDVKIADEMGERSYSLYSGGEAFRTDFALRIALSKVLARRAGTRLRTLIIDEGFGTQDNEGLEQLREAIQQISCDFDKILVVTHLEELKNAFPVQIQVTKDPQLGSRFEIIT